MTVYVAVDLGATSGRVIAGTVDDATIQLHTVRRFPNQLVERDGHLRWDLRALHEEVLIGLANIPEPVSIGIDTWGVDYGLLDDDGHLLADPIAHRDRRTDAVIDDVHSLVEPVDLYATTGTQHLPFNTIYQLAAERQGPLWTDAAHAVLLPDLLAFWLTGTLRSEATNASTTGLLDARTHQWSTHLQERLGIPAELLPPIEPPGTVRGTTTTGTTVVTVGSHDTASAVVGVPATTEHFAYISCGTWSLVGVELAGPVLTESARHANFTNELGVDDRTRFLRNVGGLWLLQECLRAWHRTDLDELLAAAAALASGGPTIDVDEPAFLAPGDMPTRIANHSGRTLDPPATIRCILDSLATAYAETLAAATHLTGMPIEVVHIVGGGSQNHLLCQLTANATGLPVIAGPVEATAIGNIAVQARTHGTLPASLEAIRASIATTAQLRRYEPT